LPVELQREHPELYEELKLYFQQDPAQAEQESV
jgi:Mlc titration factor MtfA (ptsG expression regulator)